MAKITTGDIAVLRNFYHYRTSTDDVFWFSEEMLRQLLKEDKTDRVLRGGQATVTFESGNSMTLVGNLAGQDQTKWVISKVAYQVQNSTELVIEGTIKLDADGDFSLSSAVTSIELADPKGLVLDPMTKPLSAGIAGTYKFYQVNDRLEYEVSATSKFAVLPNGDKFAITGRHNYATLSNKTQVIDKAQIVDKSGVLILEISDIKFTGSAEEEAALESADTFIDYFLSGNDSVIGTKADDHLYSGAGDDSVLAGDGADLIIGGDGAGNDSYDGGKGVDTVKYTSATAAITVNLAKGTATSTGGRDAASIGNDKLKGIENLIAGDYDDTLAGSKDANAIDGRDGNDTIDGGLGNDTLAGGAGADRFVFSTKPATTNVDTISDFETGVDKIVLSKKIFSKIAGASDYLAFGATSDSATHHLIYDGTTGLLRYDADGNGTKSQPVAIALIGTNLSLTASDIVVA